MFTSSPLIDMLLLLIMGLIGGQAFVQWRRGTWRLLDPLNIFLGGAVVVYVIQPIVFYDGLVSAYSHDHIAATMLWVAFALSCVVAGYFLPVGIALGRRLPRLPARLDPDKTRFAFLTFFGLGCLVYLYLMWQAGGISAWAAVGRGGTNYAEVTGYIYTFEHAMPYAITLLLFRAELHASSHLFRIFAWSAGFLQWLWFVYLGSRGRTILFLVTMMAVWYLPRRKNPPAIMIVTGMAMLFLLVNFQARYRGMFRDFSFNLDQINLVEAIESIVPQPLGGTLGKDEGKNLGDLEMNCTAAVVEVVPHQVNYNYGLAMLELVVRPIPRTLWPDKTYPLLEAMTPIMEARDLSRNWITTPKARYLSGPAFTFVGYYWMAGGPVALFLAGMLTGIGFRAVRTFIDRDPGNQGQLIFYTLLLPIPFGDAVATPFSWVWTYAILLVPMFLILRFSGVRQSDDLPSSLGISAQAAP